MARRHRPRPALAAGLLALAGAWAIWAAGLLAWPELVTLDLRYEVRGAQPPAAQIVVVPIDNTMLSPGHPWPLERAVYTHALINLRQAGARAVGIDVIFKDAARGDADLAAELRRWAGRAVLAYSAQPVEEQVTLRGPTALRPAQAGPARGLQPRRPAGGALAPLWPRGAGYADVVTDRDGVVHTITPTTEIAGATFDALSLALVRALDPGAATRYGADAPLTIDYAGPAGTFPEPYNLDLIAYGLFDPRAVAGKIVLIGTTATELQDFFSGPFDRGVARTPGVEIHANALQTLLLDRPVRRVPGPLDAVALLGAGLLALGWTLRLRPLPAAGATLGVGLGVALLGQALFSQRWWLDLAGPELAVAAVYVATQAGRLVESQRELLRRQIREAVANQELARAREIQQRLLPAALPHWPGRLRMAARFRPALEMSGDFYDVFAPAAGAAHDDARAALRIAVGDVAGKGLAAALVAALARATLRAVAWDATRAPSPAETLRRASSLLHQDVGRRDFVACALAAIEPVPAGDGRRGPRLRLANAAQVPPLLCRDGRTTELQPPGERLPLGILDAPDYGDLEIELQPGDVVIFSSDGLPEAPRLLPPRARAGERGAVGELFGFARLAASAAAWAARANDAESIADGIWAELAAWSGEASHHDDMTLVVLHLPGEDTPAEPATPGQAHAV